MKHSDSKKFWFVAWEGYSKGSQPEGRHELDRCCLQGPHTLDNARKIATDIRNSGSMASVIDCTESLRYSHSAPEILEALKLSAIIIVAKGGNVDFLNKIIAKAMGAEEEDTTHEPEDTGKDNWRIDGGG